MRWKNIIMMRNVMTEGKGKKLINYGEANQIIRASSTLRPCGLARIYATSQSADFSLFTR